MGWLPFRQCNTYRIPVPVRLRNVLQPKYSRKVMMEKSEVRQAAELLSQRGRKGRQERWERMTPEERSAQMRKAAKARWSREPFHAADTPYSPVRKG